MIYNSLIYIALATFAIAFTLDLTATLRTAWIAAAPSAPAPSAPAAATEDPWLSSTATATPVILTVPAKRQLLLAPAATTVRPATIASKTPQTSDDYNRVLTVEQLRRKARAAGIKNSSKMRKNQLLAVLA